MPRRFSSRAISAALSQLGRCQGKPQQNFAIQSRDVYRAAPASRSLTPATPTRPLESASLVA